jgi:hypothetical protein
MEVSASEEGRVWLAGVRGELGGEGIKVEVTEGAAALFNASDREEPRGRESKPHTAPADSAATSTKTMSPRSTPMLS